MDPESVVALLSFLPPEHQGYALAVIFWLAGATALVVALKSLIPTLRMLAGFTDWSRDDEAVNVLSQFLDWLADFIERRVKPLAQYLAAHKMPPAVKRKAAAVMAVLMLGVLVACAGSQVRTHAAIADAVHDPIVAAQHALRDQELREIAAVHAEPAKVAELRERYAPADGAMMLVIDAYNAYVDAIQAAHEGADMRLETARELLNRWRTLIDAAKMVGLDVPIPDELAALGES